MVTNTWHPHGKKNNDNWKKNLKQQHNQTIKCNINPIVQKRSIMEVGAYSNTNEEEKKPMIVDGKNYFHNCLSGH